MLTPPNPDDLSKYLKEHNVREILFSLIKAVYEKRPKDIPSFFVDYLHEHYRIEHKYRKCADDISWVDNKNKNLPIKKRITPERIRMVFEQFEKPFEKPPSPKRVRISDEVHIDEKPFREPSPYPPTGILKKSSTQTVSKLSPTRMKKTTVDKADHEVKYVPVKKTPHRYISPFRIQAQRKLSPEKTKSPPDQAKLMVHSIYGMKPERHTSPRSFSTTSPKSYRSTPPKKIEETTPKVTQFGVSLDVAVPVKHFSPPKTKDTSIPSWKKPRPQTARVRRRSPTKDYEPISLLKYSMEQSNRSDSPKRSGKPDTVWRVSLSTETNHPNPARRVITKSPTAYERLLSPHGSPKRSAIYKPPNINRLSIDNNITATEETKPSPKQKHSVKQYVKSVSPPKAFPKEEPSSFKKRITFKLPRHITGYDITERPKSAMPAPREKSDSQTKPVSILKKKSPLRVDTQPTIESSSQPTTQTKQEPPLKKRYRFIRTAWSR